MRKNASELRISLEKVVVPIFCTASAGIQEDKRQKLDKVRTPPNTYQGRKQEEFDILISKHLFYLVTGFRREMFVAYENTW